MADTTKSAAPRGADVIDMAAHLRKKLADAELTRPGRRPLHVSHGTGRIRGGGESRGEEFGSRLHNIRESLRRIDRLMAEVRELNARREIEEAAR